VFKLTVHAEPDLGLGTRSHSRTSSIILCFADFDPIHFAGLNLVRSDLWEKTSGTPSLTVHSGKIHIIAPKLLHFIQMFDLVGRRRGHSQRWGRHQRSQEQHLHSLAQENKVPCS
jgi:hypothetical protein